MLSSGKVMYGVRDGVSGRTLVQWYIICVLINKACPKVSLILRFTGGRIAISD